MARQNLPPGSREKLQKLDNLQNQAQQIAQQKAQIESKIQSVELSLEKLNEISDDRRIFEIVGELLVEAEERGDVIDDLEEKKEELEVRLKSLGKKEEKVTKNFQKLRDELQSQMQSPGDSGPSIA